MSVSSVFISAADGGPQRRGGKEFSGAVAGRAQLATRTMRTRQPAPSPPIGWRRGSGERRPELYNLATDPAESTNLIAQQPEVVARLTKSALVWNQSLPQDNGAKLGIEGSQPAPKAEGKQQASNKTAK